MYVLERQQLMPSRQGYSYSRRAQAVTYLPTWTQIAVCAEKGPLKKYAADNPIPPGMKYQISGVSDHATEAPERL